MTGRGLQQPRSRSVGLLLARHSSNLADLYLSVRICLEGESAVFVSDAESNQSQAATEEMRIAEPIPIERPGHDQPTRSGLFA